MTAFVRFIGEDLGAAYSDALWGPRARVAPHLRPPALQWRRHFADLEWATARAVQRRVGLARAWIMPANDQTRSFDFACASDRAVAAWVMPISGDQVGHWDITDLIAFDSAGAAAPWIYTGACPPLIGGTSDKTLRLFSRPLEWLRHWIEACKDHPRWIDAAETAPEAFAGLVIDRARVIWCRHSVELIGPLASVDEVRCCDDPSLADYVAKRAAPPQLTSPHVTRRRQR